MAYCNILNSCLISGHHQQKCHGMVNPAMESPAMLTWNPRNPIPVSPSGIGVAIEYRYTRYTRYTVDS